MATSLCTSNALLLQGVMGRVASWFGASTGGRNGGVNSRAQHNSSSGVPDFLAQADDPDKRRIDHARAQSRGGKRLSGQSSPNIAAKFSSHLHASSARLMCTRLTRPSIANPATRVILCENSSMD